MRWPCVVSPDSNTEQYYFYSRLDRRVFAVYVRYMLGIRKGQELAVERGGIPGGATGTPGRENGLTAREMDVCLRFGIVPDDPVRTVGWPEQVGLERGRIVLITGPSGSGKSSMLAALAGARPTSRWVQRLAFPRDVSVLDAVAPGEPLVDAVRVLTACALGEPRLWLRRLDELSEGEQFRARLARAISLHRRTPGGPLLCDEFCSSLHRRVARAIAFNLRKLVSREGLAVVVASGQDDLAGDLRPDTVVRLSWRGDVTVDGATRPESVSRPSGAWRAGRLSLARRLRIERGSLEDYASLAGLHYRQRERIGCVDRVFVLRDGVGGELLGVVVYGHSPLELSLRNEATGGRFVGDAALLNREMRILRRLVVHPDVRGCGLGRWLVAQTLPRAGTRYVECLAAMGLVNPVFEKAGMRRVGLCPGAGRQERVIRELRGLGADPLSVEFVGQVCRHPGVRRMVAGAVFDWYRSGTGGAGRRVARQGPAGLARLFRQLVGSRPVYYLWERDRGVVDGGRGREGE